MCPLPARVAGIQHQMKVREPPGILRTRLTVTDGEEVGQLHSLRLSVLSLLSEVNDFNLDLMIDSFRTLRMNDGNINKVVTSNSLEAPSSLPLGPGFESSSRIGEVV